jgi:hypothetical protein
VTIVEKWSKSKNKLPGNTLSKQRLILCRTTEQVSNDSMSFAQKRKHSSGRINLQEPIKPRHPLEKAFITRIILEV